MKENLSPLEDSLDLEFPSSDETKTTSLSFKPNGVSGSRVLWIIYFFLISISFIFLFSATSQLAYQGKDVFSEVRSQLLKVAVSVIIVFLCSRFNAKILRLLLPIIFPLLTCVGVVLVKFFGANINQANRTLLGLQPAEFFKVSIIFFSAWYLSLKLKKNATINGRYYRLWLFIAIPFLLVLSESLSAGLIIAISLLLLGFVHMGFSRSLMVLLGGWIVAAILGISALLLLPDSIVKKHSNTARWKSRIESYLNIHQSHLTPEEREQKYYSISDDDNEYQEKHAFIAIARSNGIGVFPGNSLERDILPQAFSDFIFAIIIEESGFIGMSIICGLFIWLFFHLSRWARRARTSFHRLILLGVGILYMVQAIIHMCVVVGFIPNTGQTLPFISRGGSSLIALSISMGICIAITRIIRQQELREKEKKQNSSDLVAPLPTPL